MAGNSKDIEKGIERSIDNLGRIVLPKEMRDKLAFQKNQTVSIKLYKKHIRIEKATNSCYLCNNEKNLVEFKDVYICKECIKDISENLL